MGEVVFSSADIPIIRALGLGSCVGFCVFDTISKTACIAHIMLPESRDKSKDIGKYADTAVTYAIEQMIAKGANKSNLRIAIAGGAQLFSFGGDETRLDVGKRNIEAVEYKLSTHKLKIHASDVGGNNGRTVIINSITGEVLVKKIGGEEKSLAKFYN